jgi:hypothetical protein
MSLLARRVLPALKVPKVLSVVHRVFRASKARRLAPRVSVTSLPIWQAGAAPGVLALVLDRSVACRTLLRVGFRRDKSFRPWDTVRGIPTHSSLALVLRRVPRVLRAPLGLLAKVVSRQTRRRATKDRHRSRLLLAPLPTRSP